MARMTASRARRSLSGATRYLFIIYVAFSTSVCSVLYFDFGKVARCKRVIWIRGDDVTFRFYGKCLRCVSEPCVFCWNTNWYFLKALCLRQFNASCSFVRVVLHPWQCKLSILIVFGLYLWNIFKIYTYIFGI